MSYRIFVSGDDRVSISPRDGYSPVFVDSLPDDFWKALYYKILRYNADKGFYYSVDTANAVILSDEQQNMIRVVLDENGEIPDDIKQLYDQYEVLNSDVRTSVYDIIDMGDNEALIVVYKFSKYEDLDNESYKSKLLPKKTLSKVSLDKYLTPKEVTLKLQLLDEAVRLGYKHAFYDWLHTQDYIDADKSQNYSWIAETMGGVIVPDDSTQPVVIITKDLITTLDSFSPTEIVFAAVGNLVGNVLSFSIQYSVDGGNTWQDVEYAGRFMTKPITFDEAPTSFIVKLEFLDDPFGSVLPFIEAWGIVWKNAGE